MSNALNRRDFLRMAAGSVGGSLAAMSLARASGATAARPRKRPNFLFLFADDQAFSTVGALNNPHVKTPTIDRLVRGGTAFTHAFIMGSMSGAVCLPSRAMLISGRGLFRAPLQPPASGGPALWPETFRKAGYATFGTGKWHNGPAAYARCFTHGGMIFFGGMSNHLRVPVHDFDPEGKYPRSKRSAGKAFSSNLFSDAAIGFLKQRKADEELRRKPFFLYVSYTAPHDPRMAPKQYAAMYPPENIPLPKNFMPEHPFDNGEMRIRDERLAPWPRTKQTVRQHIAAYYAMITHLDAQMGRVLGALEESGEADNTIVIFSSDNGLAVGQHGLMGKQNLYEHSARVPLVFCGSGIAKGRKIDALCYLHDLFPTTCELAGLKTPKSVESLSLVPLLTGKTGKLRDSIFGAYRNVQRMVRTERWKLIRYPYAAKTQLFDIRADPWEIHNLAGDPKHAGEVKRLNAELKEWQKKAGDALNVDSPPARRSGRGKRRGPGKPNPGAPIKPAKDGSFTLEPKAAKTTGRLRYQPDRNNLGAWTDPSDFCQWTMLDVKAGEYEVELAYGSTNPGVAYTIAAGNEKLTGKTAHTGGIRTYKPFRVGTIKLPAGKVTLTVKPGDFKGALMNVRLLKLAPTGK